MSRNVRNSRKPLRPELDLFGFQPQVARGRVRRGRGRYNAFAPSSYYYGFLTTKDIGPHGSYALGFECTSALWFNDVVTRVMPYAYGLQRLRAAIGPRDYFTAWESSIGTRVVLRRCYEVYRAIAASSDNPAPLAEYRVVLTQDDIGGRIRSSGDGGADRIAVGLWYGLELTPSQFEGPEIGTLVTANRHTDEFDPPQQFRLITMQHLRTTPNPPHGEHELVFEPMFHSQAVLQALHFARGE